MHQVRAKHHDLVGQDLLVSHYSDADAIADELRPSNRHPLYLFAHKSGCLIRIWAIHSFGLMQRELTT